MPIAINPEAARHEAPQGDIDVAEQIAALRDPDCALEILSRGRDLAQAQLCVICVHDRRKTCPFEGRRPLGVCPEWVFDDEDAMATLRRVEEWLTSVAKA